jgi:hypothetical protein
MATVNNIGTPPTRVAVAAITMTIRPPLILFLTLAIGMLLQLW